MVTQRARPVKLRPGVGDPFWELVATARRLQGPGGCPWDRAQTVDSLLPHLVEEVWEAFCAQQARRRSHLAEELGDVLYTVLFVTLLAERAGWWDLEGLLAATRQKMIRRHPHVFGTKQAGSPAEAYAHWQAVKRRERTGRPSARKLRPLLVAVWDELRRQPRLARELQRLVDQARVSGRSRRPSATRARVPGRS